MGNRRKYEGEEYLQLQLLEVTQDPTFGKHTQKTKEILSVAVKMDVDDMPEQAVLCEVCTLH